MPDTYQGTELWDFSLVDPDNRRPVDYDHRRELLDGLKVSLVAAGSDRRSLGKRLAPYQGGWADQALYHLATLQARRKYPGLFSSGEYIPLEFLGRMQEHAFGFIRRMDHTQALIVVPRLVTRLVDGPAGLPLGSTAWADTRFHLPDDMPILSWHNVFTGFVLPASGKQLENGFSLGEVLADFPVAMLISAS